MSRVQYKTPSSSAFQKRPFYPRTKTEETSPTRPRKKAKRQTGKSDSARNSNLPSVDGEPGHHVSGVPLLHADVDGLPPPGDVRVPRLHDVGRVDHDVGVDVGRVDPLAREVLGQQAAWLDGLRAHGFQAIALGGLWVISVSLKGETGNARWRDQLGQDL